MVRLPLITTLSVTVTDPLLSLDDFFKAVEKRAFKITEFAVRDRDEALDIVQNAMIKLVKHYAGHPEESWTLLFYRILHNEIKDWQRKAWFRKLFVFSEDSSELDMIVDQTLASQPDRVLQEQTLNARIHDAIKQLPLRQQQTFLLRNFEGLDVKETALAMNCSEGSVKTHYARAINFLRDKLAGDFYEN